MKHRFIMVSSQKLDIFRNDTFTAGTFVPSRHELKRADSHIPHYFKARMVAFFIGRKVD